MKKIEENDDSGKFKLQDGILKTKSEKTWIPKQNRKKFILEMHKKLCHAGVRKVTDYIKAGYDMENMTQVIKDEIQACEICQMRKTVTTKTKEIINESEVLEHFEIISIDFCGPLRVNAQGKKYILGIIDHCSKYVSLSAVRNQDERTAAHVLMNQWILKFGAPRKILLDCGKAFEARMIKELADKYKFKLQYSSPYHHSANGLIERQFRTIRDYIATSLKDKLRKDWVDVLPEIEFTMNSTIQQTINKSPAEVVFGFPIKREWNMGIRKQSDRNLIIKEVQDKQRKVRHNNDNRIHREFEIGDDVLVKVDVRSKEEDRFSGPYTISNKIHDRQYELKDKNGKVLTRNIEWLKPLKRGDVRI